MGKSQSDNCALVGIFVCAKKKQAHNFSVLLVLLLMDEILHQLIL